MERLNVFPKHEKKFEGVPQEFGVGMGGQEEPTKVNLCGIPVHA